MTPFGTADTCSEASVRPSACRFESRTCETAFRWIGLVFKESAVLEQCPDSSVSLSELLKEEFRDVKSVDSDVP